MHAKRLFLLLAALGGCWLIVGQWSASGQQTPPTENKGVKTEVLATIDLGPEIDGMQGRQLRLRLVTTDPGGMNALHSHKDRPAIVHVGVGGFHRAHLAVYAHELASQGSEWGIVGLGLLEAFARWDGTC